MSSSKVLLLLMIFIQTSCTGSYTPAALPEPNGMKEGPGLFSGKDGAFTIFESDEQVSSDAPSDTPNGKTKVLARK